MFVQMDVDKGGKANGAYLRAWVAVEVNKPFATWGALAD
jgi:hypothetical protein